jgi:acyl carrier protein phosphodiesterase
MNYLGHAYLSFGDAALLTGNMMGDHVKGLVALDAFPEGIKKGLLLHRAIDHYTDNHESTTEAKKIFRPQYGLYAGAITDTLMDYFLANDLAHFEDEQALFDFSQNVYQQLGEQTAYFPASFEPYFQSMRQHNWLYHYRSKEGIHRSLHGLQRRAQHLPEIDIAFDLFEQNEILLRTLYQSFISDIISFVKIAVNG